MALRLAGLVVEGAGVRGGSNAWVLARFGRPDWLLVCLLVDCHRHQGVQLSVVSALIRFPQCRWLER